MQHNFFPDSQVFTYAIGRDEEIPEKVASLPTVELEQVHSDTIAIITEAKNQLLPATDAAFTNLNNVHLKVKHADCLPVLIYHPSGVIGVIHAGRKGTEQQIVEKSLTKLKQAFDITDGLHIWFGPAICDQCYQIDPVENIHYNLLRKNIDQVRQVMSAAQAEIYFSNRCTAHHPKEYYSYRKEGAGVNMNWSGIALVE